MFKLLHERQRGGLRFHRVGSVRTVSQRPTFSLCPQVGGRQKGTLFGNAQDDGSSNTLITMVISNSTNLVEISVAILRLGGAFHGLYNSTAKSAAVFVTQSDYNALKTGLAGGATIPISLTANGVTRSRRSDFCRGASHELVSTMR